MYALWPTTGQVGSLYLVMWCLCPGLHLALATENGVDTVNFSLYRPGDTMPSYPWARKVNTLLTPCIYELSEQTSPSCTLMSLSLPALRMQLSISGCQLQQYTGPLWHGMVFRQWSPWRRSHTYICAYTYNDTSCIFIMYNEYGMITLGTSNTLNYQFHTLLLLLVNWSCLQQNQDLIRFIH